MATFALIEEINKAKEREDRPIKVVNGPAETMRGTATARHVRLQLHSAGYELLTTEMPKC